MDVRCRAAPCPHEKMRHGLRGRLGAPFDVEHRTFPLEPSGHAAHEAHLCP